MFSAGLLFGRDDPSLTAEDLATYAVFLNSPFPHSADSGLDSFVVRGLDGKNVRYGAKFRAATSSDGKIQTYVLVPPGKHDVTLRYHKMTKHLLVNDTFDAETTFSADLKPGLYAVNGLRDGDFVSLWVTRQDSGELVASKAKCMVIKGVGG